MASILRSSKFVRYIAGFAKNVVVNTPKEFDGSLVNTTQCFCGAVPRALATQAQSSHVDQNLERSLKRIDQDVRKSGRISRRDIEDVLEEIRNTRSATSSQSLLVIRCCGNLVPEELPEVRTKLVQEIWNTLHKLNVPMDVSHYNALLRVYLENEHDFAPTEFLSELEKEGIEPNRVTYQRLIARYCQVGDIEGATKILEYMREKQLPVNENVFNALIVGHSEADDMESAYGILGVMTQAGLEPSADTYTTLLCGYAKKGDLNSINNIFAECETKDIFLLDKDYLDIVYSLAINNHVQHIPVILEKVRRSIGYNQDAINLILRLINKGHDEAGFLVLQSMLRSTRPDGSPMPTGSFFIRQLVKANRPLESILRLCKKLEAEQMYDRAISLAAEVSLQLGNDALAYPLLEELQKAGTEIRSHFFWPLIMSKTKNQDIIDILNKMRDFNVNPNNETIRDYVIPKLKGKSTDILATLRDANISVGSSAGSLVVSLLQRNELSEAATIASKVSAYYNPDIYKRALTNALYKTKDLDNYITLLRVIYDSWDRKPTNEEVESYTTDKSEIVGNYLLDLTYQKNKFIEQCESVLTKLVEQGLSISTVTAQKLEEKIGEKMTENIASLLGKLTSGDLIPIAVEKKGPSYVPYTQMNTEQLERLIKNLDAKGQDTRGLKRQLLNLCYKNKDLQKTENLVKTLEQDPNYVLTSGTCAQLLDIYASHDKADEAMTYYKKIHEIEGENFKLDELKIVRLAQALVKSNRLEEALNILETTKSENKQEEHGFTYTSTIWRMLNTLAEEGRVDDVNKLFDTLIKNNFVAVSNILLGPLIKVHLVKKDIDKALEKFEWCVNQFKATPWKNELACQLIQSEDAEKLQKLTDLSTSVHGEINSLYDLVFAFVECGRVRQARKILETPGLQSRPQRINTACERYRTEGLVKPLEGLRDATRDLNHIDRTDIYYQLLLSYLKQDDAEKALGLWTQMQEEDLAPPDIFLIKLAGFLESKGLQVPFAVPATNTNPIRIGHKNKEAAQQEGVERTPLQLFRLKLKSGDLNGALKIKNSSPDKFSVVDVSSLIEKLTQANKLNEAVQVTIDLIEKDIQPITRVFRFLLNKLASNGDLETLNKIGDRISKDTKKVVSFDNRMCHANLVAGKADDYLKYLDETIVNAKEEELGEVGEKFPRGGAYGILERYPELADKYEEVAVKYAQRGIVAPLNVLWTHCFVIGNDEKAEAIWTQHLHNAPRIMFQRIVQTARETKDENLTRKLIAHLKISNVTEGAIGNAYSCLLDILHIKGRNEELVESFEAAVKDVKIEVINRTAILRIKAVYDSLGKPFNHTIPPKPVKNQTSSDSSSSDEKVNKS